jgi:hypothetical protein
MIETIQKESANWEMWTAVAAIVLSMVGIFLSIRESRFNRRHMILSVMPSVTFFTKENNTKYVFELVIRNAGLGPALLKSIKVRNSSTGMTTSVKEFAKTMKDKFPPNKSGSYDLFDEYSPMATQESKVVYAFANYHNEAKEKFLEELRKVVFELEYTDLYRDKEILEKFDFNGFVEMT